MHAAASSTLARLGQVLLCISSFLITSLYAGRFLSTKMTTERHAQGLRSISILLPSEQLSASTQSQL